MQGNTVIQNQHSEVNDGSALFIANSENAVIRNNTISNNDALIGVRLLNNSNCELYNNIITGNNYGIYCWGPVPSVEFCNVWNNQSGNYSGDVLPGESCLSKDPKFIDTSENNYCLEWSQHAMSPCIDKGCLWINDLDGTPSDLGSNSTFWHDHHVTVLGETVPRIRYRWVSFPVLDRDITLNGTYPGNVMLPLTESVIDEIKILSETDFLEWNGSTWQGGIEEFESAAGYKIKTIGNHQLGVSGYRIAADTVIHLEPFTKKWIGFFATEPQSIFTALASIWDNLLSIASEDWLYVKEGAYPSERCCLLPGKMYIIEVSESCDLIYTQSDVPVDVRERDLTENFSYQESPEYAAFVIDQINDPDISEIGLYLDDECIGAAVVDDFPLQLLAFLPENTRGNGELNFSFFSNNRSYCQPQEVLYRTDNNSEFAKNQPLLESGKMISVKFDDDYIPSTEFGLEGNHPNPFNPHTSIEYSIPEKGKVMLHIYNLKGQCIRTLVNGIQDPGVYNILWDGRDDLGKETSSGIYFYRLILGQATDTRKMILLK